MTEKRFKLIEESDWWGVTDNQLPKTEYGFREDLPNGYLSCDYKYNDLTPQEVVGLLNTLHEENVKLKYSLKEFEVFESNRVKGGVVTNDDFSVTLHSNNEAYMVCNMLNRFIRSVKNGSKD